MEAGFAIDLLKMKLANLSDAQIAKLKETRIDEFIEKHEGPFQWKSHLKYRAPEFVDLANHSVLLPLSKEHHKNLKLLRCIVSEDGRTLTIFLQDFTYDANEDSNLNGYVAICEKFDDTQGFIAVFYHEWYVI